MSIASRIEEIEGHIDNIYDTLELGGENIYLLPKEYIQVEYIQSSGTQYIDTGYSFNDNLNVEIKFQGLDTASSYYGVFGTRESDTTTRFVISYRGDSKKIALNYGNVDTSSINNTDVETNPVVVYNNGKQFYLDNANIYTFSNSCGTGTRNCLLFTFANVDGSLYNKASMKLYYCKMYDNGVLKRNFIPCYRTSDSVIGLYDLVEGKFYINAGTGSFIYGSVSREHENKNIVNINNSLMNRYKDFLANGTDTLWDNWEKVAGEGTQLSLTPTIKGKMKVDLKGNTQQYSTTGKNKWSLGDLKIDWWPVWGSSLRDVLNSLPAGSYTFSMKFRVDSVTQQQSNNLYGFVLQTSGWTYQKRENKPSISVGQEFDYQFTMNLREEDAGHFTNCYIYGFGNDSVGKTGISTIINAQLETGATATPYEEYTGGIASPNPDYPQDIQVVSGDNTIKVEGKNLLNTQSFELGYINGSGVYTSDNLNALFGYCEVEQNENYTISFNGTVYGFRYIYYNASKTFISRSDLYTTNQTITIPSNVKYLRVYFNKDNQPMTQEKIDELNIKIIKTNEIQTYPISLGNIELCKIGTYQDYIRKSTGKNLFDISTITENTYIDENGNTGSSQVTNLSDYIEVDSSTQYTLSYTYTTLLNLNQRNICYYDENKTFISGGITYPPTNISTNFTTTATTKYIRFSYDKNCYEIMINKGTTSIPYEPYGKVWYLNKQIGKVVLNGSENWTLHNSSTGTKHRYWLQSINCTDIFTNIVIKGEGTILGEVLCDYETQALFSNTAYGKFGINTSPTTVNNWFLMNFDDSTITTVADFKTWLASHNVSVYYPLETPTYTEITDSTLLTQLNNLYNANSYDETTNVSQVNDDLESILNVTALEDMAATASLTSLNMSRVLPVSSDEPLTESNEEEAEINTEPIEENEENIEEEINER